MDKLLSTGRKIGNTIETGKISAPECAGAVAVLAKGFHANALRKHGLSEANLVSLGNQGPSTLRGMYISVRKI